MPPSEDDYFCGKDGRWCYLTRETEQASRTKRVRDERKTMGVPIGRLSTRLFEVSFISVS